MNKLKRVRQEVLEMAARYGEADYDDEGQTWVHVPRFPLPKRFGKPTTEVLIELPHAYPQVGPDGWFMDRGLTGFMDHYIQNGASNKYKHLGWAWFCIHQIKGLGGWRAAARAEEGDNLLKFCLMIEAILRDPQGMEWLRLGQKMWEPASSYDPWDNSGTGW